MTRGENMQPAYITGGLTGETTADSRLVNHICASSEFGTLESTCTTQMQFRFSPFRVKSSVHNVKVF